MKMATRIRVRAVRRAGELLRQIEPAKNQHDAYARVGSGPSSRSEAASDAGMSGRQQKTALRIAAVPAEDFERQVESPVPPTLTALAQQGIKPRPLLDLKGRDHPGPGLLVHAARDETARTFLTPLPLTEASCLGGVMALTA